MGIILHKIRIENFRSIESIDLELGMTNLLIGQNNTGKSNFLRAINVALGSMADVSEADIFVADGERLPKTKKATIDILLSPTDDKGDLVDKFSDFWTSVFTVDWIARGEIAAFVGIRTELKLDIIRDSYAIERKPITQWGDTFDKSEVGRKKQFTEDMRQYLSAFYMDANRDIVQDLRNRKSFFGRVTSGADLPEDKVKEIEEQLSSVNATIIANIPSLNQTKDRISAIGRTIGSTTSSVEIEPLTRKLSDLNRGMDIVMQDGGASFPISQNGYGTRSWISFLTLAAFVESQVLKMKADDEEAEQYVMLTMEEPEAHLHPQAQRQLFGQIQGFMGQKVISTHSESIVSQSALADFIYFSKKGGKTSAVRYAVPERSTVTEEKIVREVLNMRSELLYSSAIVLCEGITEELALPVYFNRYFGCSPYALGVNIVGIGGQNYKTYLTLIKDFEIPWFIFSDGEENTIRSVRSAVGEVFHADYKSLDNVFVIPDGNDYEQYLIVNDYSDRIVDAISSYENKENALDSFIALMGKQKAKGGVERNYDGEDGKKRALTDYCHSHKADFALPIACSIATSSDINKSIPPLIKQLFDKIAETLGLELLTETEE